MMGTDSKYWVIVDDLRKGPYNHDEILAMDLPADTPVWRDGLSNWMAIKDLEDFGAKYNEKIPPIPGDIADNLAGIKSQMPPVPQEASKAGPSNEQMPPTYLAWAIVAMLFCCLITGIITLVYSFRVSSRYAMGDYEGARRASNLAETWLIITIVCGLITAPFQFLYMLL